MKVSYDYGLSKIYELVINSDPSYAFLLETNSLLHNKFVVAHVFGHTDFFKHNIWFGPTNRQMLETVSQNAQRIRQYGIEEGNLEAERFLDAVLALADHIDPYPRREPPARKKVPPSPEKDLLRFLLEHADHLEDWQWDIIANVREESLYFVPQMQTKIMNEGWASFWHLRIMHKLDLTDERGSRSGSPARGRR